MRVQGQTLIFDFDRWLVRAQRRPPRLFDREGDVDALPQAIQTPYVDCGRRISERRHVSSAACAVALTYDGSSKRAPLSRSGSRP